MPVFILLDKSEKGAGFTNIFTFRCFSFPKFMKFGTPANCNFFADKNAVFVIGFPGTGLEIFLMVMFPKLLQFWKRPTFHGK